MATPNPLGGEVKEGGGGVLGMKPALNGPPSLYGQYIGGTSLRCSKALPLNTGATLIVVPACDTVDKTATALLDCAAPSPPSVLIAVEEAGKSRLKSATIVPITTADAFTSLIVSELNCWKWSWLCCTCCC